MIDFAMPALGADMDEGMLNEWLVKPGDTVSRGQIVAVVETTKAAVEIECWHDGVVAELLVPVGQTVAVGTPLARLLEPGEKPGAGAPPAESAVPDSTPMSASDNGPEESPAAPPDTVGQRQCVSPVALLNAATL
ncbi:MAG: 2-oxo acid dehydrogenase subunit E2, partial [Mycobacterium sp.]|nr:2-oxo acid dehydrogenase subunit E2 [Mycobacterium sp.]